MVKVVETQTVLLPAKFVLIVTQVLLLVVVLLMKDDHIYWKIG